MRDRETDSWWSIMTSKAIGGPLDKADLRELPYGEKAQWEDWVRRHPNTLVLSVDGREHDDTNPYDNYFGSDGTFRDLEIDDHRLKPKEPIFAFWLGDRPVAVPHRAFARGKAFKVDGLEDRKVVLYRPAGASMFLSTRAYLVDLSHLHSGKKIRDLLPAEIGLQPPGFEAVPGIDTFWYNWVAVHADTLLLP